MLECLFQFLPTNSTSFIQAPTSEAQRYAHYQSNHPYVYSSGWDLERVQHGTTNSSGFVHSRDFGSHAKALVIGDSYVQSLMLRYADTLQGQLEQRLGPGVLAASASGNGLADSLELARVFVPSTHPEVVILFVERSDVVDLLEPASPGHSDFRIGPAGISTEHHPYQKTSNPTAAWLKAILAKSSLVQYLGFNIGLPNWFTSLKFTPRAVAIAAKPPASLRKQVLDYYFQQLNALAEAHHTRFVFLVDADRGALYTGGQRTSTNWNANDRSDFIHSVSAHGFTVIDTQPLFQRHWQTKAERLDFLPADGHWNPVAHRLAAQEIMARLELAAPLALSGTPPPASP